MTPEIGLFLATLKGVLELGWPALVTVFLFIVWRKLERTQERLDECLTDDNDEDPDLTAI